MFFQLIVMLTVMMFKANMIFMARNVLLTGYDTHLGYEIGSFLNKEGYNVLATVETSLEDKQNEEDVNTISWKPSSSISAKNLLLQTRTFFETVDEIITIYRPIKEGIRFQDYTNQEISNILTNYLFSSLYLCKESLQLLRKQKQGNLTIIIYEETGDSHNKAIDACVYEGFRGFATSLIGEYTDKRVTVFDSKASETDSFLEYYYDLIRSMPKKYPYGKYVKHKDRRNFFWNNK